MIVVRSKSPEQEPEPQEPEPLDDRLSFDLPSSLKARVRELAAARGTSMSDIGRRALVEYVANQEG